MPRGWTARPRSRPSGSHPAADQAGHRRRRDLRRGRRLERVPAAAALPAGQLEVPARGRPGLLHQPARRRLQPADGGRHAGRAADRGHLHLRPAVLRRGHHRRRGQGLTVAARPEESTATAVVAVVGGRPISHRASRRSGWPRCGADRGAGTCRPSDGSESARDAPLGRPGARDRSGPRPRGASGRDHRRPAPHGARAERPALSASDVARLVDDGHGRRDRVPSARSAAYYERNRDLLPSSRGAPGPPHPVRDDVDRADGSARLAAGGEWRALAETRSIDAGSRTRGGDLGDVHRGELAGPLEDAIFDAEVGAVIGPIQTEHGWHVARVDAVTGGLVRPVRGGPAGHRGGAPGRRPHPDVRGVARGPARRARGHRARIRASRPIRSTASRATDTDRRRTSDDAGSW